MTAEELAAQGLREIETDRQRGASQLAQRCLQLLAAYARQLQASPVITGAELQAGVKHFATELQAARPSMAPITNLLQHFKDSLERSATAAQAADGIERQARLLIEQSQRAVHQVARHTCKLVKPGDTVFTHSFSSTIATVFDQLARQAVSAIITESRPGNEGKKLAEHLSLLQIPTEYITDAQIDLFIRRSDIVLVGADTLLTDGGIVNKSGTCLLAMCTFENKVPFYVCCESYKQSAQTAADTALEEKDDAELQLPPLPCIKARNIYFDITPARWISGYISEHGLRRQADTCQQSQLK